MTTQHVSPPELRAESGALLAKASTFQQELKSRQAEVMALKWEGVAKRAFENMFTEAAQLFEKTKVRLDGIANSMEMSAAAIQASHQAAADAAK